MKLTSVVKKSLREQTRQFWIFFLTISMAPFFVVVYYLINEASKPHYDLLILNQDEGVVVSSGQLNYGDLLLDGISLVETEELGIPLTVTEIGSRSEGIEVLRNKKADALAVIPEDFSRCVDDLTHSRDSQCVRIELVGDLTNVNYVVSAVWADDIINELVHRTAQLPRAVEITETGLGFSGDIDDFDLWVPGILILSVIMLMFSATIAIVTEVENKTIIRLKLSKISALEFLAGVSVVQIMIGIISVLLTLVVAVLLGFDFSGSLVLFILLVVLTSISIIAFSLILAAFTKTVNEVLIVGNFPLFLFMFFTGAAFPMKGKILFSIGGYPVTIQGLMSPTHSISALNKILIMNMGLGDILPEMIALVTTTILYFVVGVWSFRRRHMKVE